MAEANAEKAKKNKFFYAKLKAGKESFWDSTSPDRDRAKISKGQIIPMYRTGHLTKLKEKIWEEKSEDDYKSYWVNYFTEEGKEGEALDKAFKALEVIADSIGKYVFRMHKTEYEAQLAKSAEAKSEEKKATASGAAKKASGSK